MSEPDGSWDLTLIGNDAETIKINVERVFALLRKTHPTLKYIGRAEINTLGGLPHAHGFYHCDTTVSRAEFASAAAAVGAGRQLHFEEIPDDIKSRRDFGAVSYHAYPFKALADPELFDRSQELNKRVDGKGNTSYPLFFGRGFFRNGRSGEKLTKRQAYKESWRQRREGYSCPKSTYAETPEQKLRERVRRFESRNVTTDPTTRKVRSRYPKTSPQTARISLRSRPKSHRRWLRHSALTKAQNEAQRVGLEDSSMLRFVHSGRSFRALTTPNQQRSGREN
jgi:hypothetical protein